MTTTDVHRQEPDAALKICAQCRTYKPLSEFLPRSGRRAGRLRRRGTCRACRRKTAAAEAASPEAVRTAAARQAGAALRTERAPRTESAPRPAGVPPQGKQTAEPGTRTAEAETRTAAPLEAVSPEPAAAPTEASPPAERPAKRPRRRRRGKAKKPAAAAVEIAAAAPAEIKPKSHKTDPGDASALRPTRQGFIRMRGKTDNGRRWYQEVDPELAITLVKEHAAVVVNRHTIRRIYSNKEFRRLILTRDNYTCHFCGQYGDTIDHLLPRAKGGHTTPVNCVCACNECNQSKAARDLDEFMGSLE